MVTSREKEELPYDEKKEQHHANITVLAGHENEAEQAEELVLAESEFTEAEYKRLLRKIDLILMPMLMIIYGLQFSDKSSLANGVVFGLREDTKLVGNQYADLTIYFYVAYAVAQYPMAWGLQHFPLGRSLAICVIIWGATVMCLGACNNYAQLSVTRVFLGWFEAVVTPGFAIFTASWYLRREQSLRQTLYFSMNTFFAMIFGVGTYYIALEAQRKGGLAAWRVINLFLGGITVGMGIIFLIFGGTPDEVWWLSKREKRMAKARIISNGTGHGGQHAWRWDQVKECLRDPQYWFAVVYNLVGNIPNGGLTTFQTLIFKSFGFSSLETILYGLPMYALTFVCVVTSGFTVYYFPKARFPIAILVQLLTMTALLFAGLSHAGKWAKWGVWMMNLLYSISSFILAWPVISINVAGRTKKSFVGATSLLIYCIGNIIGSQVFRPKDAPRYITGLIVCAAAIGVNVLNFFGWWYYYIRENKRREEAFIASGLSMEERERQNRLNGEMDLTDKQNPHFRYIC